MKKPVQHTMATLQKQVDAFNKKFAVGERVYVKMDDGSKIIDVIRHRATIMGGHTAVAWLENKGSYLLNRVSEI